MSLRLYHSLDIGGIISLQAKLLNVKQQEQRQIWLFKVFNVMIELDKM